ncbi:YqgE/AlgH family protein [Hasllibacter sp. MH4015]|uniref:YqgE/AlgH family protein n=1 Tax=Hasllibacter sp. MH4015 TaxID=2854029 RepID=UPI001CD7919E|nr:YqgE/AlgH family protein [Hasllibacter sp. MH4015]
MAMPDLSVDLTGKLLIAMPAMEDPRFAGAVVFVCAHAPSQSMGLIVNKVMEDITFAEMMEQLEISRRGAIPRVPVCFGGPVEMQRGFVLHSSDYRARGEEGMRIDHRFSMTGTLEILEDIAAAKGPHRAILALGYAGWGEGQLDAEIQRNDWLTVDATPELVFDLPMERKWNAAVESLGINPLMLSSEAGHA